MPTVEELTAERDRLQAENENLRGQLAAAGAGRVVAPTHAFMLSEGQRAELETYGVTNYNGQRMTIAQARERLAASDNQQKVELKDPDPNVAADLPPEAIRGGIRGVDYVYPSVAPGVIDPKVAGTPGISGPPAGDDAGPARTRPQQPKAPTEQPKAPTEQPKAPTAPTAPDTRPKR